MNIKLNLIDNFDDLKEKGDASIFIRHDKTFGLIIVCPNCGNKTTGPHIYDKEHRTLIPSIIHDINLGGCGWHGWLKNGEFIKC